MTAQELGKILIEQGNKLVSIRYEEEVRYSEWTRGTESVIVEVEPESIIIDEDYVILAADLCSEK